MPILPTGSYITINGYPLRVTDVRKSFILEPFDRAEFMHERLRQAPNARGQKPIITSLLGNTPAQIVIGSVGFDDPVPLNPDVTMLNSSFVVTGAYSSIKKKFNIERYDITGAPSDNDSINSILAIYRDHAQRLSRFQAYLQQSASMETEYDVLIDLQSEDFSYLTTTDIKIAGNAVEGETNHMLITSFSPDVAYEEELNEDGDQYRLLRSFSLTIENRLITSLDEVYVYEEE